MTDDYNIGTTLGVVGAGVSLYAVKGVVDMVQGGMQPRKRSRRKKQSVYTKRRKATPVFGDGHFHL
jgi:hypothetical protein